jgi:hypothetical protein
MEERGKTPPPPPSKYNASKMNKERQLLSSCVLHSKKIAQEVELLLNKFLGEDVYNIFGG